MNIGQWVRRVRIVSDSASASAFKEALTKWHYIDSTVARDAFLSCGRRLQDRPDLGEFELSDVKPLTRMIGQPQLCKQCDRGD